MKLSAPIYVLKQRAKAASRRQDIRLHAALDDTARDEGYASWSHLAASWQRHEAGRRLYAALSPGDLVLVGSRPGQGKTLLGVGLAVAALSAGHRAALFTLASTPREVDALFVAVGRRLDDFGPACVVDTADDISAPHIVQRAEGLPPASLIVVDYLQLLDQKRARPPLDEQLHLLKALALDKRLVVVCLSQISRQFEQSSRPLPTLADVLLPNPADLSVFDKSCFLHQGRMTLHSGAVAA